MSRNMTVQPEWCGTGKFRINIELIVRQKNESEDCTFIPVRCKAVNLKSLAGNDVDPASLFVVRYIPETGKPVIFDPDKKDSEAFRIPHRFEADYAEMALPRNSSNGDIVWLALPEPVKQYYSIYFNPRGNKNNWASEHYGLIGDGDPLLIEHGKLSVPGNASPVLYGDKLFGRKGLVLGSAYEAGIYFFEEIERNDGTSEFVNRGRLRDKNGNVICGIPTFHDIDGNGLLDLITGRNDGTVHICKNTGTNIEPVFNGPVPMREVNGRNIDLKNYLKGRSMVLRLADGRINENYPSMPILHVHGCSMHIYTTLQFVDWNGDGNYDLLIGTKGGLMLNFKATPNGFQEGRFVKDESGNEDLGGLFPNIYSREEGNPPDIVTGDFHGFVQYLKFLRLENGVPVFRKIGRLKSENELVHVPGVAFPLVVKTATESHTTLLVGDMYGQVKKYKTAAQIESEEVSIFSDENYLLSPDTAISRMMAPCHYVDMDEDGRKDLLTGDIKGGIFIYRNLGTDKNPIFSDAVVPACKDGCPVEIKGGPDPQFSDDGYSKPVAADLTGNNKLDIVAGSGLGKVYFFENCGLDRNGMPEFEKGRVLKDIQGNNILSHHMSSVEVVDWNGDGVLDLLVGGQKKVHNHEDEDTDDAQVKWFRGIKDGILTFAAPVPITAEGDTQLGTRPKPRTGKWQGRDALFIGNMIFRQPDKRQAQKIEFLTDFPNLQLQAKENFVGADYTFASLGPSDPCILKATCTAPVYAFRQSFAVNRGYLDAAFKFINLQDRERKLNRMLEKVIDVPADKKNSPHIYEVTKQISIPFVPAEHSWDLLNKPDFWQNIPGWRDFTSADGGNVPPEFAMELKLAYSPHHFILRMKLNEPDINSIIAKATHDNGPIQDDDHIQLIIKPENAGGIYYRWFINSRGYRKEYSVDGGSGATVGPWTAGKKMNVDIKTQLLDDAWELNMRIPFEKLNFNPVSEKSWGIELRHARAVYADSILRASEQRRCGLFSWAGMPWNIVKLDFKSEN